MNKVTFKKKMFLLFCYAVHEQQHEVILKDNGYQVFFFGLGELGGLKI